MCLLSYPDSLSIAVHGVVHVVVLVAVGIPPAVPVVTVLLGIHVVMAFIGLFPFVDLVPAMHDHFN